MKTDNHPQTIRFTAQDGWALEGTLYQPSNPKLAILVSAGTGFPRSFYHTVACWLAGRGAVVLTYDYRGMGGSKTNERGFFDIDYPQWGHYDMPAALDILEANAPSLPITHLAHSVGGHFVGLMPNHRKIQRHAFISVGTGYFGGHHLKYIPTAMFFWWGLGSYMLLRHNQIKQSGGWSGEALPPKLFRTWRRWSRRRAYFRRDFDSIMAPHDYAGVTAPIRSWIFPDDPIATHRAASDILNCYPAAPGELIARAPSEIGVKRIGHEGAFRKGRERLWAEVLDWLTEELQQSS